MYQKKHLQVSLQVSFSLNFIDLFIKVNSNTNTI